MEKVILDYLEYLENDKHYSKATISSYLFDLKDYNAFLDENEIDIKDVNEKDIQEYLNKLKRNDYEVTSINRKLVCLRNFYKYLKTEVDDNILNPVLNISNLKTKQRLPKDLFEEQVKALLTPCEKKEIYKIRNQCLIGMLLQTGMRVSEIVNLDILDIDKEMKTIRVFGKGSKERQVYFMDSLIPLLDSYYLIREKMVLNENEAAVFIGSKGTRITKRAIENILNDRAKHATNPFKVTPHMLRHTFATNLLNNGVDIKMVQELLGHESISTTQIYTHVSKQHLKEVYENTHPMAKILNKIKEEENGDN